MNGGGALDATAAQHVGRFAREGAHRELRQLVGQGPQDGGLAGAREAAQRDNLPEGEAVDDLGYDVSLSGGQEGGGGHGRALPFRPWPKTSPRSPSSPPRRRRAIWAG